MHESITLYCQKNGADKVYTISLEAKDGGFTVTGWNGRRGGALKAQPKTATPLPYAEAKKIFDDLVKSKVKGGYTPGAEAAAYVAAVGTSLGIDLHLLKPASETDIERFITDDSYVAQEKHDGERRPVARRDDVLGGNRNGFAVPMPKQLIDVLSQLPPDTEIDCEQVGDILQVFDTMKIGGVCQRNLAFLERMRKVGVLIDQIGSPATVRPVDTVIGTDAKRALYHRLRAERKEGIVFKRLDARYGAGKNDDQIKVKFLERATLQVSAVHPTKRSVSVQGIDGDGRAVALGNVTIPANHMIPAVGELCEIEYLYVVTSLCQPQYLGVRTDLTLAACTTAQLKYRAGIGDTDDDTLPLAA